MSERFILWMKRIPLITCMLVMMLVGLSACDQAAVTPQRSQLPIKIGVSVSASGDFAPDAKYTLQGYQLWTDTVNKDGGILGRPVKLVVINDDSTPERVRANYEHLIKIDHVDLTVGPFSSLLTKAAREITHQYGYALLEGSGGGPSVFNGYDNVLDVSLPVVNNLLTSALYILSLPMDIRPKTVAFATEDDPFTQPQIDLAKQKLLAGGVSIVYYHAYPADTTKDYTPLAKAIIETHADAVILGTLLNDLTAFMTTFKQYSYTPKILVATAGPDQGDQFVKAVGIKNTEAVMVPNGWYPQAQNYQNAQMVRDYLAHYGGTVDTMSSNVPEAYAVGQVLVQALNKIHSLDNKALINELHSDAFNSVQGPVRFDKIGQNVTALPYLFQWQKGKMISVFPASIAVANPEYPKPSWV
ncbi:MAG: amino acid ABC transporter substrate-binding protein [Ktedonobacteraceae bacterium]